MCGCLEVGGAAVAAYNDFDSDFFLGNPPFRVWFLKRWVSLFYSLPFTGHFLRSASPRKKTYCNARFRFRARVQTVASRSIFAALFAFPAEAAHPLAR